MKLFNLRWMRPKRTKMNQFWDQRLGPSYQVLKKKRKKFSFWGERK